MVALLLLTLFACVVLFALGLGRMAVLTSRIAALEERLSAALAHIGEIERALRAAEPAARPAGRARTPRRRVTAPAEGAALPVPVPAPALPPVPAQSRRPSRTKEEWEALIGGKLLNRIGALALILGVAFFLQYAFANDWITEPVRVLIGVLIGGALIALAARAAARNFTVFAQGLVGAGIAILYLSAYASFNYYHLLSQPVAFLFMGAVTVVTFTQAFRYDSLAVALLGWLGGFLTPFLLSTGDVNTTGLFAYIAILDAGLLAAAWRKPAWMPIEPLAMAGTYLIYALWLGESYTAGAFIPGALFLVLFWLMFHAVHTARFAADSVPRRSFRLTLASLHGAVFYILLYVLLDQDHAEWRVPATLAAAIMYFSFALAVRRRSGLDGEFLQPALTGAILLVVATHIEFSALALVQYWTVEALALVWGGTQWRLRSFWWTGLAVFLMAIVALVAAPGAMAGSPAAPFTLLLNRRAFTFALLAAGLALSGVITGRAEWPVAGGVRTILHVAWTWVLFVLLTVETNDWFATAIRNAGVAQEQHIAFLRTLGLPVIWGAYGLALVATGVWRSLRAVKTPGLIMVFLAAGVMLIRGLTYEPVSEFTPLLNLRVLLLLLLAAECALALRLITTRPGTAPLERTTVPALQVTIVLLLLVLVTGEIWDYYAHGIYALALNAGSVNIAGELSRLQNLRQLFLSAGWVVFSILLMALGIGTRSRLERVEAIILFGAAILKIFIYDLSFLQTLYRIFSFAGLGIVLLGVSWLYQRYRGVILGGGESTRPG